MAEEAKPKDEKSKAVTAKEGTDEILLEIESGLDQNLAYALPPDTSAFDRRSDKATHSATDLREVPREAWYDTQKRPDVDQLVSMRRMDGQSRALYRLLVLPIRASLEGATFVADEDGDAEAQFINDALMTPAENGGMTVTFSRFMAHLLLSLFDGFAAFEKVFWIPESGPLKGKVWGLSIQADRLHPTEAAQPLMLDRVWRELKPLLNR